MDALGDPVLTGLRHVVLDRLSRGHLDGLVGALVLAHGDRDWRLSIFAPAITLLLDQSSSETLHRGVDVAILGCRMAFGRDLHKSSAFVAAALHELEREPCPPLACVRDDDRLLLGISAGIGAVAHQLIPKLETVLTAPGRDLGLRRLSFDTLALALARGESTISESTGRPALADFLSGAEADDLSNAERVTVFWFATRLMGSDVRFTASERQRLLRLRAQALREARLEMDVVGRSRGLDPILLFDALSRAAILAPNPEILAGEGHPTSPVRLNATERNPHMKFSVFFSYSHRDEAFRDTLETHLKLLQRQGIVATWHDRRISPGTEWAAEIDLKLEAADIILLLISADFIASDYCFGKEMKRALERHHQGDARVIPIILRTTDLTDAPFMKLQALPRDARPVTKWEDQDDAWADVAQGIRKATEELRAAGGRSA